MRRSALFLSLCSCAGVGGVTERSFTRDELGELEIRTIDVLIVAKGPPLAAGELLELQPFDAPRRTTPLGVEAEDEEMREALAVALAKDLTSRGFAVHFAGQPAEIEPPRVAPMPKIETS